MTDKYGSYCVVRYTEDMVRDESINIGVVVYDSDNKVMGYDFKYPWMFAVPETPWFKDKVMKKQRGEVGPYSHLDITDFRGTLLEEDTVEQLMERFVR